MVDGEINLTCNAWQASNTDGYFTVTGHWIEERAPRKWKLEHALLGFTLINMVFDWVRPSTRSATVSKLFIRSVSKHCYRDYTYCLTRSAILHATMPPIMI